VKRRVGLPWRIARGLGWLLLGTLACVLLLVLALRWIDPPTSAFMLGTRMAALATGDHSYTTHYQWVDLEHISPQAALAVIAAEDQQFPFHAGFDFKSIREAVRHNAGGHRVHGASTISQQVAKNLFLWSGQSYFRKGLEAGLTVLIERCWPKERILEVYLNIAEFGRGIYGVQAAAQHFFREDAQGLNRSDSALLAAVLPNPRRYRVDAPTHFVLERRDWIAQQMDALGGTAYLNRVEANAKLRP
jgi:monofunctional biosynthetic peptidoglycan transglycosylase